MRLVREEHNHLQSYKTCKSDPSGNKHGPITDSVGRDAAEQESADEYGSDAREDTGEEDTGDLAGGVGDGEEQEEPSDEAGSEAETEEKRGDPSAGAGAEGEEEPSGGAVSEAEAEEDGGDPSAEDSPIISSQEGSDDDEQDGVGEKGKKCSLCEFRASTEMMMTCHLLDRHVPREMKERILNRNSLEPYHL